MNASSGSSTGSMVSMTVMAPPTRVRWTSCRPSSRAQEGAPRPRQNASDSARPPAAASTQTRGATVMARKSSHEALPAMSSNSRARGSSAGSSANTIQRLDSSRQMESRAAVHAVMVAGPGCPRDTGARVAAARGAASCSARSGREGCASASLSLGVVCIIHSPGL